MLILRRHGQVVGWRGAFESTIATAAGRRVLQSARWARACFPKGIISQLTPPMRLGSSFVLVLLGCSVCHGGMPNQPIMDTAIGAFAASCAAKYCQGATNSSSGGRGRAPDGLSLWLQLAAQCGPYDVARDPTLLKGGTSAAGQGVRRALAWSPLSSHGPMGGLRGPARTGARGGGRQRPISMTPNDVAFLCCIMGAVGFFLGYTLAISGIVRKGREGSSGGEAHRAPRPRHKRAPLYVTQEQQWPGYQNTGCF